MPQILTDYDSADAVQNVLNTVSALSSIIDVDTNVDKAGLEGGANPITLVVGQVVRIVDEADRLEMYIGGLSQYDTAWMVLRNSYRLFIRSKNGGVAYISGGISQNLTVEQDTEVGWISPTKQVQTGLAASVSKIFGVRVADSGGFIVSQDNPASSGKNATDFYGMSLDNTRWRTLVTSTPVPERGRVVIALECIW